MEKVKESYIGLSERGNKFLLLSTEEGRLYKAPLVLKELLLPEPAGYALRGGIFPEPEVNEGANEQEQPKKKSKFYPCYLDIDTKAAFKSVQDVWDNYGRGYLHVLELVGNADGSITKIVHDKKPE